MIEHRKADPRLQLIVAGRLVLAASARTRLVDLGRDGVRNARELLLLLVVVLRRGRRAVLLQPLDRLLNSVEDSLLVLVIELATKTLVIVDLGLEAEGVVLEAIARLDALTLRLVLLGELLGCNKLAYRVLCISTLIKLTLLNHAVDLLLGKTALVIGDGDGFCKWVSV